MPPKVFLTETERKKNNLMKRTINDAIGNVLDAVDLKLNN